MTDIERRRPNGTFLPGVSGNPGGVPRRLPATAKEVAELAASYTPDVVEKLAAVVEAMDPRKPSMAGIKAAELILNRAHGLPVDERERFAFDAVNDVVRFEFSMSDGGELPGALSPAREDNAVAHLSKNRGTT